MTTIELKSKSFKVNLYHFDMKEQWRFKTYEEAQAHYHQLIADTPGAKAMVTDT